MENYLFYAYLKYQEDNKLHVWKNLFKYHKHIFAIFLILLTFAVMEVIVTFLRINCLIWSFLLLEFLAYFLLYYFTEKDLIELSEINYENYCNYCKKLNKWLNKFDINNYQSIYELLQRIKLQISEAKDENEKSKNRFDKWLQTLVIPIVITMVTTIITKQNELSAMIEPVVTILIVFVVSYITITSIKKISDFPKKRKIEQMQCFANDLQGVLYCIKKDKEKQLYKSNISKYCKKAKH